MRDQFANQPDWTKEPPQMPDPLMHVLIQRPWLGLLGEAVVKAGYVALLIAWGLGSIALGLVALCLCPFVRKKVRHV